MKWHSMLDENFRGILANPSEKVSANIFCDNGKSFSFLNMDYYDSDNTEIFSDDYVLVPEEMS